MNCAAPRPARNQKLIPLHSTQTGFVGFFLWSHGSSAVIRLTVALENVILLRERMGGGVIGVIGVRREEGRRRKEGGGTWLTAALCHPLTLLQRRRESPWKGSAREDSQERECAAIDVNRFLSPLRSINIVAMTHICVELIVIRERLSLRYVPDREDTWQES